MLQALIAEIKNVVFLLGNEREPVELNMRACMGISIQLMRDLRNTVVESGQYREQVARHTSKVLAECRTKMGLLFRSVPCHAEGGRVTPEVQRIFVRVMNLVIDQFDNIIKESLKAQNLRDPDPQNVVRGELKKINHNLKLFRKLIASKKQVSKGSRNTERHPRNQILESKEHNEQLDAFKSNIGHVMDIYTPKRTRNNHDSQLEERRLKHLPQSEINKSENSTETESQHNLLAQSSSTSLDLVLKEESELESNVAIVGSYQNIRTQDRQVLWAKKGQPTNRTECTSTDFRDLVEFKSKEATVGSIFNTESQTSLGMQDRQDLQVLWVQEKKPLIQTSSSHSDFIFKDLPHLVKDKSQSCLTTESLQDLQVLWERKEKPMTRLTKLPENDESEIDLRTASSQIDQPIVQTVSAYSDLLFKDLPKPEKLENQSSWITESSQNLQVIKTGSTFDFKLKDQPQPETEKSQTSWITESTQDSQVLCSQKDKPMIQTGIPPSDFMLTNVRDKESGVTLLGTIQNVERPKLARQDLEVLHFPNLNSMVPAGFTSSHPQFKDLPQNEQSKVNLKESQQKEQPMIRTVSAASDLVFQDLPKLEEVENQSDWVPESSINLQTGSTSSHFSFKNQTEPEPDVALIGSTQNIECQKSFRIESRPDLLSQKENIKIQTSSTPSDFIFKVLPKPEKDKSETTLRTDRSQSLQTTSSDFIAKDLSQPGKDENHPSLGNVSVVRNQIDKPRTQTRSYSDLSLKNLTELESNRALPNSVQNIQSRCLPPLCIQKDNSLNCFKVSDFLLKDKSQPDKVESKTCLASISSSHLQDLWIRPDNSMVDTSSSSFPCLDNKTNSWSNSQQISNITNPISAEIPVANTAQLTATTQLSSRNLKIMKPKSAPSFFSVGKTFGDHRLRLLRWCQEKTKDYGVPMYEFSESWRSGRALVAVIHSYRQDLIEDRFNPKGETKESPRNMLICGAKAAKSLGVGSKVDIVQVCLKKAPDFCKVFTFVGELQRCLEPKLT